MLPQISLLALHVCASRRVWARLKRLSALLEGDDRRGYEPGAWCGECTEPLFRLVSSAGAIGSLLHLHLAVSQNRFVRNGAIVDTYMARVLGHGTYQSYSGFCVYTVIKGLCLYIPFLKMSENALLAHICSPCSLVAARKDQHQSRRGSLRNCSDHFRMKSYQSNLWWKERGSDHWPNRSYLG
jgi:hypothetical protein